MSVWYIMPSPEQDTSYIQGEHKSFNEPGLSVVLEYYSLSSYNFTVHNTSLS